MASLVPMADIFDVIADGTRREILQVLLDRSAAGSDSDGDMSVGEIVAALEISQPTVSKHLKVLRDAGLVTVRDQGQHRYYRLDPDPLEDLEDWLIPFLSVDFASETLPGVLGDGVREFAGTVGRVFADTSHRVSSAVGKVTKRR